MPTNANAVVRKPAVKDDRVADSVTLDHHARRDHHRNVVTEGGIDIHIHLHDISALRDGDALKLEDGRLVRIHAAEERLYEIRTENPARLARLAWHLGSNHVAMEAAADALFVAADPVVDELIRGQGATFAAVTRRFDPERDAHHHHHDHGHGHSHNHGHEHAHGHGREGDHAHDHSHSDHSCHDHKHHARDHSHGGGKS